MNDRDTRIKIRQTQDILTGEWNIAATFQLPDGTPWVETHNEPLPADSSQQLRDLMAGLCEDNAKRKLRETDAK